MKKTEDARTARQHGPAMDRRRLLIMGGLGVAGAAVAVHGIGTPVSAKASTPQPECLADLWTA